MGIVVVEFEMISSKIVDILHCSALFIEDQSWQRTNCAGQHLFHGSDLIHIDMSVRHCVIVSMALIASQTRKHQQQCSVLKHISWHPYGHVAGPLIEV